METGVCYFPEHWPEATWAEDAARMHELGLSWVRIGEFAWSALEPESGALHFDWLDRAIDTLGDAGLKVVLCTPTATPPKWLIDRSPDILPVGADGAVRRFGSRRHYCFTSPTYRHETERIVRLLGERYGEHGAVHAWQLDNEYGCHDTVRCYCDACASAFRLWLEARYGDIVALNEAWWTRFWSQHYRSFAEVDLPNLTVTEPNPSHSLDFYRFASDQVIGYNRLQTGLLRELSPGRRLTHNAMGFFGDFDHHALAADLDTLTWDSYPLGHLEESPLPDEVKARYLRVGHPDLIGFMHDLYYGAGDRPFWVMEQQPGQVNWAPSNPLPAPGAVELWSHQAFAHGADAVVYFRWRAALGAQEQLHAGLRLHDGGPDRASNEACRVAATLPRRKAHRTPSVALLFDYPSLWAGELQPHAQGWSTWALVVGWYAALRALAIDVDIVPTGRDLTPYRLALAPALMLVDGELATHLQGYVERGGTLVLGPRSGSKGPSNLSYAPAPGPLAQLAGVRIDHVDALRPGITGEVAWGDGSFSYHTWADLLTPIEAEPLAHYRDPAYGGAAALTQRTLGAGSCITLGAWGSDALHGALFARLLTQSGVPWQQLPEGVRVTRRSGRTAIANFLAEGVEVELEGRRHRLAGQRLHWVDSEG
jgi:beta-galactosidase